MKNYTKITAEDVKNDFSRIIKRYIGPKTSISYKRAARELEIEERTLGSWVRGEKPINLLAITKMTLYLPSKFSKDLFSMFREYRHK